MGSNPTPRTAETAYPQLSRYLNYLLTKKSLKHATIKRKVKTIKSLLKHGVEISNPDNVVRFLNECSWESGTKDIAIDAYRDYLNMLGLTDIKLPHIRREEKDIFIPLETELDTVINNARSKMSVFCRILKETAIRPIEAWRLRWMDVDVANKTLSITPAKYSRPRKAKISEQTLNLLSILPRTTNYIFSISGDKERFSDELEHFARNFCKLKIRVSKKLMNPRIRQISLKTFRHWRGTMEYIRTRDIYHVKEFLGHKNIQNTIKYVHLASAMGQQQEDFICKTAKSIDEASKLIESGYDYVCDVDGFKLFRKLK